jgi:hypothetical protein
MLKHLKEYWLAWGASLLIASLAVVLVMIGSKLREKSAQDECHSISDKYGVFTTVIDHQCYVKVGSKFRLSKDWTTPERLDYLSKLQNETGK